MISWRKKGERVERERGKGMVWVTSGFNQIVVNTLKDYDPKHAPALTLVYGPSGVGKTDLLRSCFLRLKKQHRVVYIDAQEFSRSFAYAAQKGSLSQFRDRLRSTSLLIFDHLETLKGKKQSIEELLHTYESLFERGAKMIVGFQGKISELDFLGEKLCSRLLGGLAIPIHSPSESEMFEYLNRYSQSRYLILEEKVIEQTSSRVKNFREAQEFLQGFTRYAESFDVAMDREAFSRFVDWKEKESFHLPTPENIVRRVAILTDIDPALIYGDQRQTRIREARQLAIYAIRKVCQLSYPDIGQYFNKAHSSIIKSCQQFPELMKENPAWEEKYKLLLQYFRSNSDS